MDDTVVLLIMTWFSGLVLFIAGIYFDDIHRLLSGTRRRKSSDESR